jgi:hypothetical protein
VAFPAAVVAGGEVRGERSGDLDETAPAVADIWLVWSMTPPGRRCPSNGTSTTVWPWVENLKGMPEGSDPLTAHSEAIDPHGVRVFAAL